MHKLRIIWLLLTGQIAFPEQLEEIAFMTALSKSIAALALLGTSSKAMLALSADNATKAETIDQADADLAGRIDNVRAPIDEALKAAGIDPTTGQPFPTTGTNTTTTDAPQASTQDAPNTSGAPTL